MTQKKFVVIVVKGDGDVVGEVPCLKAPDGDRVRLELADLVQRGAELRPVLLHLKIRGGRPEQRAADAAHAERAQADRLAHRIDLAQLSLAEAVLVAIAQISAGPTLLFRRVCRSWIAHCEEDDDEGDDCHDINCLAAAGTLWRGSTTDNSSGNGRIGIGNVIFRRNRRNHWATSRCFKHR